MTPTIADEARRRLVPYLGQLYATVAAVLPYERDEPIDILDLGAGTGGLSSFILDRFPNSHITLVDASEETLERARHNLGPESDRLTFLTLDFARDSLPSGFHAVMSALAIHHLSNIDTRALYRTVFSSLLPGGMLINADRVAAPSMMLADRYHTAWRLDLQAMGASDDEIAAAEERQQDDNPTPVLEHLQWLVNASFRDVDVFYRNLRFSVHGGRRPRL